VVRNLYRRYVRGLLRMAEHQQLMLEANRDFRIEEARPPEVRGVARATNALAEQRDTCSGRRGRRSRARSSRSKRKRTASRR
jgi:DNA polymerase III subunit epsilon